MNFEPLEKIANAVLYEGFLLYPYRESSVKNQKQWHFGTIGPVGGSDPTLMQTQCLVQADNHTVVHAKIRFLQAKTEREIEMPELSLSLRQKSVPFSFPPIVGRLEIQFEPLSSGLFRFTLRIVNLTEGMADNASLLSAHALMGVSDGAFLSLMDPPEEYRSVAASCKNIGTWPVLAGREGEHNLMLSSPIILYDYPQIAPESAGDFFDGTEIDEILTLRVMTLTEEEKQQVRAGDERGKGILERTETLPREAFAKMHGAIRNLRKASQLQFREGDRVRLHPRKKADIFDIALDGKIAIVESVERDFENNIHLAVTVEDDPGRDLGVARQIAHRFFFGVEEVELV